MGQVARVVPFDKVRPFQARIDPPFPDESLLGFVTRALSVTAVKQIVQGLALGGLDTGAPQFITTSLTEDREIAGVATLMKTSPEEIRKRTYRPRPANHSGRETVDFFGTAIRLHYREARIRRVSPRALEIAPYHRAIWELRPLSFDPRTRETLIDTCPVCSRKLGWRRAQGPTMCDLCVDKDGFPSVDLRDFPQPLVEIEDDVALDFVTGLVDPDPDRKAAARRLLPGRWLDFSNGDLFETVMAFASGLTMDPSSSKHAQGRAKNIEHFARITPEILALAGRAIIGGEAGFAALADRYRLDADKRPGYYGRRKEIGPLAYVVYDKHVQPKIRKLVGEMVDVDMARDAQKGKTKVRRAELRAARVAIVPDDGFKNIIELATQFGINRSRFERLAKSGLMPVVRAQQAGKSPVCMAVVDVLPLVMMLPDTMVPSAAAGLLGIPIYALPGLAERNLIERLEGPIRGLMPGQDGYRRSSVESLVSRIRQCARKPVPDQATRMSRAIRALDFAIVPWDAIISAIVDHDLAVYAYPATRMNVRSRLAVTDMPRFVKAVAKHTSRRDVSDVKWVGANTVSEILKVTEIFVYRLAERRPSLLKRKRNGHTPFLLEDVQKIAEDYIFMPEICERSGAHARRMCRMLRERGIEPPISLQGNRDFGFRRDRIEKFLVEQETLHKRRLAELEKAPDNERTRLIRAVEAGTPIYVAAKNIGIPYKRALICMDRWRDTGDWRLGKGGVRSPLDQHTEWLKSVIARDPGISLSGIRKALNEKRRVSTSNASLLKWLDRHSVVLMRRRRPQHHKVAQKLIPGTQNACMRPDLGVRCLGRSQSV